MKIRRTNNTSLEIIDELGNLILQLTEKYIDGAMLFKIKGQLTNEIAHEFEDELMAVLTVCSNIILDLSETTYISSPVLRCLLSVQQIIDERSNSKLIISKASDEVISVMKESGFDEILIFDE